LFIIGIAPTLNAEPLLTSCYRTWVGFERCAARAGRRRRTHLRDHLHPTPR